MALPVITFDGRMVNDPEMRFTPTGKAVVSFRVAANDRKRQQDGSWADGPTTFLKVTAWEAMAENVAEAFAKGDPVIVVGKLEQEEFEDREGNKRTAYVIRAFNIAAPLKQNAVDIKRTERSSAPQQQQASVQDVWGAPPNKEEEPPF